MNILDCNMGRKLKFCHAKRVHQMQKSKSSTYRHPSLKVSILRSLYERNTAEGISVEKLFL